MKIIIKSDIVTALKSVGLQNGDSVMVHTSLGQIGYVCGGAQTIIESLIDVVGQNVTIMMPTQSWKMVFVSRKLMKHCMLMERTSKI